LAPGGDNSVDVPELMFARLAVHRRGGHAHPIMWEFAEGRDIASHRQRVVSQVEIDGADHAMVVPGRLMESAAALGQAITAVEDFLDHVIWPQPSNRGRIM
jgi:hypothetical protein